ncbi:hypothetical protein KBA27_05185 [bacterium]|nr:hypothetical protein [bacterium]
MYSEAFMRYLINYQKPEYDSSVDRDVRTIKFKKSGGKLAEVLLTVKK